MEKRTILVILFSVVFILAYQKFVIEPMMPKKPLSKADSASEPAVDKVAEPEEAAGLQEQPAAGMATPGEPAVTPETETEQLEAVARRILTLENDRVRMELDNRDGVIVSCILKAYTDAEGEPMELINDQARAQGWLPLLLTESGVPEGVNWEVESIPDGVRFHYRNVTKDIILADGYELQVRIAGAENGWLSAGAGIDRAEREHGRYTTEDGIALYTGSDLKRLKKKNLDEELDVEQVDWVAVEDKYFARILDPEGLVPGAHVRTRVHSYHDGEKPYQLAEAAIQVPASGAVRVYMGPKRYHELKALGNHYEKIVDFGFFGVFAKWLFFALKWMNNWIGNFGWTIVVLTLLMRILLFPLNQAGLKSMKKMQTIQPKIKAIQEKYKKFGSDMAMKQKMNQEMQELYKSEGVNPLGGCLPMLLQMPIFFAFWSLLLNAIELRHAPFMLWIQDLSAHDPYFVLPVLMGATQLVSQVITPSTGDKNQKRMMYVLPIVFTVVLAYAPSGLIVYWTTNNIAQIFQQILINRATEAA